MSAVELFLAKQQRFQCERLCAALTVEQCKANRERVPAIFACSDCAGLSKAIELEERVAKNPVKDCAECGEYRTIKGRGLCGPCYHKLVELPKKQGEAPQVERIAPEYTPQKSLKCSECGEPAFCKGLCRPCYDKVAHARRNAAKKAQPPTGSVMAQGKVAVVPALPVGKEVEAVVDVLSKLLPVVSVPPPSAVVTLPDHLLEKVIEFGLSESDLVAVLDAFLHGELERHVYRRVA